MALSVRGGRDKMLFASSYSACKVNQKASYSGQSEIRNSKVTSGQNKLPGAQWM